MKHLRHLFTALLLLCSTVAFAHDFEVDGIYYNITDAATKTVEVSYKGNSRDSYDDEYSGKVVIPKTVEYGGVAYSITQIGDWAFSSCHNLVCVEIPNSVTELGAYAFSVCDELKSIKIPNSVTSIRDAAFASCSGLASIVIPNSVTSIGWNAFEGCSGLTSIEISNSVTSIGYRTFYGCSALTAVAIPDNVIGIDFEAFYGCEKLVGITMGNGVQYVGNFAFAECKNLADIYCLAATVPSIGSNTFDNSCPENATLYVPAEAIDSYRTTAPWSSFGNIVEIGSTNVETVKGESGKMKAIYDFQGRNVDAPKKGLYIVDGKKVFIK